MRFSPSTSSSSSAASTPPDLPGFFWDAARGRYFPLGSRRPPAISAANPEPQNSFRTLRRIYERADHETPSPPAGLLDEEAAHTYAHRPRFRASKSGFRSPSQLLSVCVASCASASAPSSSASASTLRPPSSSASCESSLASAGGEARKRGRGAPGSDTLDPKRERRLEAAGRPRSELGAGSAGSEETGREGGGRKGLWAGGAAPGGRGRRGGGGFRRRRRGRDRASEVEAGNSGVSGNWSCGIGGEDSDVPGRHTAFFEQAPGSRRKLKRRVSAQVREKRAHPSQNYAPAVIAISSATSSSSSSSSSLSSSVDSPAASRESSPSRVSRQPSASRAVSPPRPSGGLGASDGDCVGRSPDAFAPFSHASRLFFLSENPYRSAPLCLSSVPAAHVRDSPSAALSAGSAPSSFSAWSAAAAALPPLSPPPPSAAASVSRASASGCWPPAPPLLTAAPAGCVWLPPCATAFSPAPSERASPSGAAPVSSPQLGREGAPRLDSWLPRGKNCFLLFRALRLQGALTRRSRRGRAANAARGPALAAGAGAGERGKSGDGGDELEAGGRRRSRSRSHPAGGVQKPNARTPRRDLDRDAAGCRDGGGGGMDVCSERSGLESRGDEPGEDEEDSGLSSPRESLWLNRLKHVLLLNPQRHSRSRTALVSAPGGSSSSSSFFSLRASSSSPLSPVSAPSGDVLLFYRSGEGVVEDGVRIFSGGELEQCRRAAAEGRQRRLLRSLLRSSAGAPRVAGCRAARGGDDLLEGAREGEGNCAEGAGERASREAATGASADSLARLSEPQGHEDLEHAEETLGHFQSLLAAQETTWRQAVAIPSSAVAPAEVGPIASVEVFASLCLVSHFGAAARRGVLSIYSFQDYRGDSTHSRASSDSLSSSASSSRVSFSSLSSPSAFSPTSSAVSASPVPACFTLPSASPPASPAAAFSSARVEPPSPSVSAARTSEASASLHASAASLDSSPLSSFLPRRTGLLARAAEAADDVLCSATRVGPGAALEILVGGLAPAVQLYRLADGGRLTPVWRWRPRCLASAGGRAGEARGGLAASACVSAAWLHGVPSRSALPALSLSPSPVSAAGVPWSPSGECEFVSGGGSHTALVGLRSGVIYLVDLRAPETQSGLCVLSPRSPRRARFAFASASASAAQLEGDRDRGLGGAKRGVARALEGEEGGCVTCIRPFRRQGSWSVETTAVAARGKDDLFLLDWRRARTAAASAQQAREGPGWRSPHADVTNPCVVTRFLPCEGQAQAYADALFSSSAGCPAVAASPDYPRSFVFDSRERVIFSSSPSRGRLLLHRVRSPSGLAARAVAAYADIVRLLSAGAAEATTRGRRGDGDEREDAKSPRGGGIAETFRRVEERQRVQREQLQQLEREVPFELYGACATAPRLADEGDKCLAHSRRQKRHFEYPPRMTLSDLLASQPRLWRGGEGVAAASHAGVRRSWVTGTSAGGAAAAASRAVWRAPREALGTSAFPQGSSAPAPGTEHGFPELLAQREADAGNDYYDVVVHWSATSGALPPRRAEIQNAGAPRVSHGATSAAAARSRYAFRSQSTPSDLSSLGAPDFGDPWGVGALSQGLLVHGEAEENCVGEDGEDLSRPPRAGGDVFVALSSWGFHLLSGVDRGPWACA